MLQQLQFNRIITFLLGILFLSQTVGAAVIQNDFAALSSVKAMAPTPGDDAAQAVASQTDGKLIVAGQSKDAGIYKFSLVRYNTDGSLDTTFGAGGKILTAIRSTDSGANVIAVLPDGKILAAGYHFVDYFDNDFALVKYNSNGTLDTKFGIGGIVTTNIGYTTINDHGVITYRNNNDRIYAMAIQSDGKIVVGGNEAFTFGGPLSAIVRYNADGRLDASFGSGGKKIGVLGEKVNGAIINSIAIQGSKIVVGGAAGDDTTVSLPLFAKIARLNSNGSPDTSFGSDGARFIDNQTHNSNGPYSSVNSIGFVAVYAGEDKIVMTGNMNSKLTLWSVNSADGTFDTTFGTGGRVLTNYADSSGAALKVQLRYNVSDKIVVAGNTANNFLVARFTLDGRFDSTFNGGLTTYYGMKPGGSGSLLIQPSDNKIVVVGSINGDFQTLRYNSNGMLDSTFNFNGVRTDNIGVN